MKKRVLICIFVILVLAFVYFLQPCENDCPEVVTQPQEIQNNIPVQVEYADEEFKAGETVIAEPVIAEPVIEKENAHEVTDIPQSETLNVPVFDEPNTETEYNAPEAFLEDEQECETVYQDEPEVTDLPDENFCYLSISCKNVFLHMDSLNVNKKSIIPPDGMFLHETKVNFEADETVFNVLRRTLKQNKIHLEFSATPIYNSMYIEGIGNLYEFDCGELSGWTYRVNGVMPSYSCSEYTLKAGDKIEFVYVCDFLDSSF